MELMVSRSHDVWECELCELSYGNSISRWETGFMAALQSLQTNTDNKGEIIIVHIDQGSWDLQR